MQSTAYALAFVDGVTGDGSLEWSEIQLTIPYNVEANPEKIWQRVMKQSSYVSQCSSLIVNAINHGLNLRNYLCIELFLLYIVRVAHTFTLIFRQRYKNLLDDIDLSKEIIKFVGIKPSHKTEKL